MFRRALLTVVAALGAVPVLTGLAGVVGGLTLTPDDNTAPPYFDSEYRFLSVVWAAVGVLLWWSLRHPQERATVTRVVLAVMVLGGVARLLGVALTGLPPVPFRISLGIEVLVIPVILLWHRRVFPAQSPAVP